MNDKKLEITLTRDIEVILDKVKKCDFETTPTELKNLLNSCSRCELGNFETPLYRRLKRAEDRIFILLSMKYDIKKFHVATFVAVVGWVLAIIFFLINFLTK